MAYGKHRKPKDSSSTRRAIAVCLGASVGSPVFMATQAEAAPVSAWDRIAECESNGRWNLPYGHASSTGGLQIQKPTWDDYGGTAIAAWPYMATKAQQIEIAEKILAGQGPTAWTCNAKTGYPLSSSGPNASHLKGGINPNVADTPPAAPAPKAPAPSEPADAEDGSYTVREGDTLSTIAKRLKSDGGWKRLYQINKGVIGDDANKIKVGCKLRLPGHEAPEASRPGPVTVMSGDTLYGISLKLGAGDGVNNWRPLYRLNEETIGKNPNLIFPGQSLNVPQSWSGKAYKPSKKAQKPVSRPASPPPASTPSADYVLPLQGRVGDSLIITGNCISRTCGGHSGLDISAPQGTPVRAAAAGTVVSMNDSGAAYGNHVVIKHAGGIYTLYGHMSANSVSVGQTVSAGQQVGYVGSTGVSSGPHLHFEVRTHPKDFGVHVFLNPVTWLRSHGVSV